MEKTTYLKDLYSFPGFRALARLKPHPNHPGAMVVTLQRRQKKRFVNAARYIADGTTSAKGLCVTLAAVEQLFIWSLISAASNAQGARL
jgi:hypothetical protein